jgi:hypothetical protein
MANDDLESYMPFKLEEERALAFQPDTNKYVPMNDVREQWTRDSESFPSTKEQRKAFYQQRIRLVESSEVSEDRKLALLEGLNQSLEDEESHDSEAPLEHGPIPGGVGYGAYYRDGSLRFKNYSVLYYKIVTIPDIGNAANDWLYLTSTNRAPKGVEAYVAYHGQNKPMFNIFDWSKEDDARFALSRPYDWLDDYLIPHPAGTSQYQTVHVVNSTRRIAGTTWTNDVMVYNQNTQGYDLVYSSQYDLPSLEEENYLWWGPIVETFPPFPFSINDVGFFDAQLLQDGDPPALLTTTVTDLETNHAGAKVVFDQPNYSFVVHW